ncbi:hypothetical protein QFC20_002411 [Naganishia adeliensis]|uniref:Uncharacterized protein n=1 Tax=Naganishia adeliensis TaxID=92952 RepID=A0ACC2WKZ2_9TREE|nr:hypothetical protein QFC20_002411 [Naganishia adeliensis]
MPTKVKMSGTEVKARRDDGVAPSSRLRQTSWREIQERQEMRKSPLYKRQQPSAVVRRRSVAFPDCPVIQGNFALARYPATDITTSSTASQIVSAATEGDCLEACETYTSKDASHDVCVGYVFKPFTEMCYLKVNLSGVAPYTVD